MHKVFGYHIIHIITRVDTDESITSRTTGSFVLRSSHQQITKLERCKKARKVGRPDYREEVATVVDDTARVIFFDWGTKPVLGPACARLKKTCRMYTCTLLWMKDTIQTFRIAYLVGKFESCPSFVIIHTIRLGIEPRTCTQDVSFDRFVY